MPDAGVVLRRRPPCGCLNLRGNAAQSWFRVGVADIIGLELPTAPCTWHSAGDASAYWLGPDEWLLIVPSGAEADVEGRLRDVLDDRLSVTDVSGGQILMNLSGPQARTVLQKSSPCDFHARHFPPGRCVQTVFAKTHALIAVNADSTFDLVIRRSYSQYVSRWIADAANEYGYVALEQ